MKTKLSPQKTQNAWASLQEKAKNILLQKEILEKKKTKPLPKFIENLNLLTQTQKNDRLLRSLKDEDFESFKLLLKGGAQTTLEEVIQFADDGDCFEWALEQKIPFKTLEGVWQKSFKKDMDFWADLLIEKDFPINDKVIESVWAENNIWRVKNWTDSGKPLILEQNSWNPSLIKNMKVNLKAIFTSHEHEIVEFLPTFLKKIKQESTERNINDILEVLLGSKKKAIAEEIWIRNIKNEYHLSTQFPLESIQVMLECDLVPYNRGKNLSWPSLCIFHKQDLVFDFLMGDSIQKDYFFEDLKNNKINFFELDMSDKIFNVLIKHDLPVLVPDKQSQSTLLHLLFEKGRWVDETRKLSTKILDILKDNAELVLTQKNHDKKTIMDYLLKNKSVQFGNKIRQPSEIKSLLEKEVLNKKLKKASHVKLSKRI